MACVALQSACSIITYVLEIIKDVEMNVASITFLSTRLALLQPGIEKLMASKPDSAILPMANTLCECCTEARDFIEQFTKKTKGWVVNKARKVYNRGSDRETIKDLLRRIEQSSQDLNLGVVIDIKDSVDQLSSLFHADAVELQEMVKQMWQDASLREDTHELQHHGLSSALEEIKRVVTSLQPAGGQNGKADSSGNIYQDLPSLDEAYTRVSIESGAACSSDDDDNASLGSGVFGEVYLTRGKIDNKLYAVKYIRVKKAEQSGIDKMRLLMEGSNMQRLTHQNIIRMWNQCQRKNGKYYCLVMDYADEGTLDAYVMKHGRVETVQAQKWLSQLCAGLHHMHRECRMLHRDLKPQNILLTTDSVTKELSVRITDLGLASMYESKQSMSKGVGTTAYMSPEKVRGDSHYDEKDDMWAVGCILYELLTGASITKVCSLQSIVKGSLQSI
jgi:tRNA A-37 threonylcarbamoyl transferase component Bud32